MKSCTPCLPASNPLNWKPAQVFSADHVVVGLGTSGAALAWGLSNNKCLDVFAIEAGQDRNADPAVLNPDPFNSDLTLGAQYHLNYALSLGAFYMYGSILGQMGKGWGGSSLHNYLLTVRGTPTPYNSWGLIDPRWSYAAMLPYMIANETYTPVISGVFNAAQRGDKGPLFVTQVNGGLPPLDPAGQLAVALGAANGGNAPFSLDYNDHTLGEWVSGDQQTYNNPDTFERSFAGNAYLSDKIVRRKENGDGEGLNGRQLRIKSNAMAFLLLIDRGIKKGGRYYGRPRVYGVRYVQDGIVYEVHARTKVHLSCGAFEDAALLQRSGIGAGDDLAALGIDVVIDNANVGANMQNHYGPVAVLPLPDPADPTLPPGFSASVSFYDLRGPNGVGVGTGIRQFQSINQVLNFGAPAEGMIQMLLWNLRPARVGTVKLQDLSFPCPPQVALNSWSDAGDISRAVQALKVAANISLQYSGAMPISPPAAIYPAPFPGGLAADDSELEAFLLTQTTPSNYTAHFSGTARMSVDATTGVVDGKLNVHGIDGLSVCSNAAAPTIEDGNASQQAYFLGLIKSELEGGRVL